MTNYEVDNVLATVILATVLMSIFITGVLLILGFTRVWDYLSNASAKVALCTWIVSFLATVFLLASVALQANSLPRWILFLATGCFFMTGCLHGVKLDSIQTAKKQAASSDQLTDRLAVSDQEHYPMG